MPLQAENTKGFMRFLYELSVDEAGSSTQGHFALSGNFYCPVSTGSEFYSEEQREESKTTRVVNIKLVIHEVIALGDAAQGDGR